ncbi:MAG TPA: helix-hairpin-helix domain-containing protein, partial [Candidatus Ozemobacteraceae bacterium]|nr:helix-hairpin-helix domain-containing protein [Candidatus Ozemobacteraceae bacterium]
MEDRLRLIGLFEELAMLCDLAGENPFKARAFEKAARTLQSLDLPLGQLLEEPPPGFGKGLLDKVREFLRTEHLQELDNLRGRFPATLFDLLKVQGLGPKKVKLLYESLQIADLDALEKACQTHRIAELKGFGTKTEEKILAGIESVKRFRGQFRRFDVEKLAADLIAQLTRQFPGMPCEAAGSFRRRKEIVKDLDLLVATDAPVPVMRAFVSLPGIRQVLQEGETKSAVILNNGLQVDLRVVPPESYGPALCHFTGSKEHNIRMRQIAQARGLKLNEYGVFDGDRAEAMATEADVFAALSLPFIEPELREDLGEIEWAQTGRLPRLITREDLLGTLHAHTTASDGTASLAGMSEAAGHRGLRW